jgi:ribosomal protein L37AE/L43A
MESSTGAATACPSCGYQRKATDRAPDWQCPRCGIAYAKYAAAPAASQAARQQQYEQAQKKSQSERRTRAIRLRGLLMFVGGGIVYVYLFLYTQRVGGIDKVENANNGGLFAGLLFSVPGVIAMIGLFELASGAPIDTAMEWWDGLRGWQRGLYGIAAIIAVFFLIMVGVVIVG